MCSVLTAPKIYVHRYVSAARDRKLTSVGPQDAKRAHHMPPARGQKKPPAVRLERDKTRVPPPDGKGGLQKGTFPSPPARPLQHLDVRNP